MERRAASTPSSTPCGIWTHGSLAKICGRPSVTTIDVAIDNRCEKKRVPVCRMHLYRLTQRWVRVEMPRSREINGPDACPLCGR